MIHDITADVHGISGFIVFGTALLQFVLKKGGRTHRLIGKIYGYTWIVLLTTGAYLGSFLITIIGIFGFYFALTGWRIGRLKNKPLQLFDKIVFYGGAGISIYMLYTSARLLLNNNLSFGIIFAVFGLLFLFSSVQDITKYIYQRPIRKQAFGRKDWYFEHFTRMSISFIAAVTAFASIHNVFQNNTLNFLLPTLIGVVAIRLYKRREMKKLSAG
jgi:MFS family permease